MPNVNKSQLIEIVLPGVATTGNQATKIQFPDQPYLRFKKIQGIETLSNNDMTLSPTNKTPLTTAQLKTCYLTLYLNDPANPSNVGEWIQNVPFTILHRIQNSALTSFGVISAISGIGAGVEVDYMGADDEMGYIGQDDEMMSGSSTIETIAGGFNGFAGSSTIETLAGDEYDY